MHRSAAVFAALVVAALTAPIAGRMPAGAVEGPVEPTSFEMGLVMASLDEAVLKATQRFDGERAAQFARSVDASSGDGDGTLRPDEADAAARGIEHAWTGSRMPGLALDLRPALAISAEAEIHAPDGGPVSLTLTLQVRFEPSMGGHVLDVSPSWNASVTIRPPEGWTVELESGQPAARFEAARGEETRIVLLPAPAETVFIASRNDATAGGAALVLVAVAAAAAGRAARR